MFENSENQGHYAAGRMELWMILTSQCPSMQWGKENTWLLGKENLWKATTHVSVQIASCGQMYLFQS